MKPQPISISEESDSKPKPIDPLPERRRVLLYIDSELEEKIKWALQNPQKRLKVLREAYAKIYELERTVRQALPLTPRNAEEYQDLLWRFTTDPHALGLPRDKLNLPTMPSHGPVEMTYKTWLKRYREYVAEVSKRAPKGDPGAPQKEHNRRILEEWDKRDRPRPTGKICDEIGVAVHGTRLEPGSELHHGRRETVRRTIKREIERRKHTKTRGKSPDLRRRPALPAT